MSMLATILDELDRVEKERDVIKAEAERLRLKLGRAAQVFKAIGETLASQGLALEVVQNAHEFESYHQPPMVIVGPPVARIS